MEKYNPFENRYPNRKKIIFEKDRFSEKLLNDYKSLNYQKDISSLNDKNNKLNLFIKEKQIKMK